MPAGIMETVVVSGSRYDQWLRAGRSLLAARCRQLSWLPAGAEQGANDDNRDPALYNEDERAEGLDMTVMTAASD